MISKKRLLSLLFGLTAFTFNTAVATSATIDLKTWNQQGEIGNGNWVTSPNGQSTIQTKNGNPTFFVSPNRFLNTTLRGTIKVEATGNWDDDFIGFVIGEFASPTGKVDPDYFNFLLFDWKQATQKNLTDLAQEGFSLVKVTGSFSNNYVKTFWGHIDSPEFDVLATDYGSDRGWEDNTEYQVSMLYQSDRLKIDIDGKTIFDIKGDFSPGYLGFYNYSQPSVRYSNFTEETEPKAVPIPNSILSTLLLATIGFSFRYRKYYRS